MTQADPRIEARERLEVVGYGWRPMGLGFKVVGTSVSHPFDAEPLVRLSDAKAALSEAEGELDRMREALERIAAMFSLIGYEPDPSSTCVIAGHAYRMERSVDVTALARAALSPTRRTGDA